MPAAYYYTKNKSIFQNQKESCTILMPVFRQVYIRSPVVQRIYDYVAQLAHRTRLSLGS